jgi:hypothetical protein
LLGSAQSGSKAPSPEASRRASEALKLIAPASIFEYFALMSTVARVAEALDEAAGDAVLLEEVHAVVAAEQGIVPVAVRAADVGAERAAGVFAERAGHVVQVPGVAVLAAVAGGDVELEAVARLAGRDDHRAGHRVAAVEGALRALQDLDLADVGELLVERVRVRLQHAVDHEREIRLRVTAGVDAADRDLQVAGLGGLHLRNTGGQGDEVLRPLDARGLDLGRAEGAHGHRHVLQALLALAGGDDDFLELGLGGARLGGREDADDAGGNERRLAEACRHAGAPELGVCADDKSHAR